MFIYLSLVHICVIFLFVSIINKGVPFGEYIFFECIVLGGMVEIFCVKSVGLGGFEKVFVIKCLYIEYFLDDQFVKMLVDEVKIMVLL